MKTNHLLSKSKERSYLAKAKIRNLLTLICSLLTISYSHASPGDVSTLKNNYTVDYGVKSKMYNLRGKNKYHTKIRVVYEFNSTKDDDVFYDVDPGKSYSLNVKQGGAYSRYIAFYTIKNGKLGNLFCHGEIKNWDDNLQVLDIEENFPGQKNCLTKVISAKQEKNT